MGYYTDYTLKFDTDLDEEVLLKQLEDISSYSWYGSFELMDVKWYDHETHMKIISKMYPDTIFSLYGDGEENGDLWVRYFKDGKVQYSEAKILYPQFDKTRLY